MGVEVERSVDEEGRFFPWRLGRCCTLSSGPFAVVLLLCAAQQVCMLYSDDLQVSWPVVVGSSVLSMARLLAFVFTAFLSPGYAPATHPGIEEPPYPVVERKANGEFRYNKSSMQFKPDRAHFCHIRQAVVLRMDHYDPWSSNTIGFYNHKFYVLFLMYNGIANLVFGAAVAQTVLRGACCGVLFWLVACTIVLQAVHGLQSSLDPIVGHPAIGLAATPLQAPLNLLDEAEEPDMFQVVEQALRWRRALARGAQLMGLLGTVAGPAIALGEAVWAHDGEHWQAHELVSCVAVPTMTTWIPSMLILATNIRHILQNVTLIEAVEKGLGRERDSPWDMGTVQNVCQVMGPHPLLWPLPLPGTGPQGDGIVFPLKADSLRTELL